jgi:hypothetical protein
MRRGTPGRRPPILGPVALPEFTPGSHLGSCENSKLSRLVLSKTITGKATTTLLSTTFFTICRRQYGKNCSLLQRHGDSRAPVRGRALAGNLRSGQGPIGAQGTIRPTNPQNPASATRGEITERSCVHAAVCRSIFPAHFPHRLASRISHAFW